MAAIPADRDLLFGLLALQNGLINQGQLVAAFQAWTLDKARALADHLVARGDLDSDQRAGVEAMVGLHLKKHGGSAEKSLAALPAGRSTRESLAALGDPDIEHTLTQLASGSDADPDRTASYAVGTTTSDGQRFRVLRPHARGGLGAVFVALDSELHREVALKQILDQHAADAISRQRFLLEAEITGGLEHPGIVPVYGLGTYADGRPFYAMRFIRGDSLKEAVEHFHADAALKGDPGRRTLALQKLLRRFLDVCNAISYAHSRGVLHRDIKPGNIMLGDYGETLVVDWGLAKAVGHRLEPTASAGMERTLRPESGSEVQPTAMGSLQGTPAYMPPEQAAGRLDELGAPSDVYSLGATLYALLTGRAPFAELDLATLLRQVERGEFPRPRQVHPWIDPALEAVCLKAMALWPQDRYSTPRALAADIEHWLADEPVTAYREPTSARLGRWVRRHKPAVAAAVALLFTAVVALSVSTVLIGFEQSRTRDAYRAEAQQRRRAEGRSRLARRAVDDMYTQVAERWLAEQPQMQQVQREFLEKARDLYGELADEPSSEPALRREVAAAHRRVGDIEARLGRYDQAEQSQGLALAIAEELCARSPADPAYRFDVALVAVRLGRLQDRTGRYPEAEQALRRGVGILSELAQADPGRHDYRRSLAEGRYHLAFLLRRTGRWPDAEPEFRRAAELAEALEREGDGTLETLRWHANILTDYAGSLSRVGRLDEAVRSYRQAIGLFDRLIAAAPAMPLYRGDLTSALASLGFAEGQQGALADAEGHYRRAIDLGRRLVGGFPDVPHYRDRLEYAYNNLALLLQRKARPAEAEAFFRQAIELAEELLRESPDPPGARADLVRDLANYGNFLQYVGRSQEAEATLRRAIAISERLVADFPEVPEHRVDFLALNECSLADLLRHNGRLPEAEAAYRRVLEVLDAVPTPSTDTQSGRQLRALALGNLGQARMVRLELTEAERLLERAVEFGRANLRLAPHNVEALRAVASFEADLAKTRLARGDGAGVAAAAAAAAKAAGELLRITGEQPDSFDDGTRLSLASIYDTLGLVFSLAGRHRESQEAYGNAVTVYKRLVARHADQPDYRSRLGGALNNLGMALAAQGDYGSAILRYHEAIGHQRAVFDQQPQVEQFRRFLSNHYKGLGEALRALGRSDEVVEAARERMKLWPGSPGDLYDVACDFALCMPIAKDAAMRGRYADEAMAVLRAAVAAGWSDAAHTTRDSDLNPLRHRPDFRTLLVELFDRAFPADPFARDR